MQEWARPPASSAVAAGRGAAARSAWRQPSPNPRRVPASTPISANTITNVMTISRPKITQPLVVASKLPNAFCTSRPAIDTPNASQNTPSRQTGRR